MRLDLSGTQVSRETAQAWRNARPGRQAHAVKCIQVLSLERMAREQMLMSMSLDDSARRQCAQRAVPGSGLRAGLSCRARGPTAVSLGARAGSETDQRGQHAGLRGGERRRRSWSPFAARKHPRRWMGSRTGSLTNANNYLILPEGRSGTDFAAAGVGARFHRGFLDALEMIWEPLFTAVDQAVKGQGTAALDHWP